MRVRIFPLFANTKNDAWHILGAQYIFVGWVHELDDGESAPHLEIHYFKLLTKTSISQGPQFILCETSDRVEWGETAFYFRYFISPYNFGKREIALEMLWPCRNLISLIWPFLFSFLLIQTGLLQHPDSTASFSVTCPLPYALSPQDSKALVSIKQSLEQSLGSSDLRGR